MRSAPWLPLLVVAACEDKPKPAPDAAPTASIAAPATESPPEEGCVRALLEGAENDPACVLARVPDGAMRDLAKQLAVEVKPDRAELLGGGETLLRVVMENLTGGDLLLVFDALSTTPAPRPDTSRLSGVREDKTTDPSPRLRFEVSTTYADNRSVDGLPTVPGAPSTPKLVGVRIRAHAKLTASVRWWALRIPAPPPSFTDDAGHRWYPKTAAVPLPPGEYGVHVDVPFHGVAPYERSFSTKIRVVAD